MAAFNSTFQTDLAKPSRVVPIPDTYTRGDNESHTITVLVYDSANPNCGLMAGSVSAAVARQDGNTIPLTTGTKGAATVPVKLADGSTAQATPCTVTLKQACFDCPGQVVVVIRLVSGETITSIFVGSGKVNEGLTNSIIDPGDVITDITALIAAAEQAAEDAEEALAIATHVVRYDETQTMTSSERAIASHNVGAHKIAEVFDPTATYTQGRYVLYLGDLYRLDAASFGPGAFNYSTGGWTYINPTQEPISLAEHAYTDAEKAQARENIGAGSAEDVSDLQMTDLQLGGMISDVGHSLAAEYDWQAGTYAVGDYVMSGDKLYRCTTAIATPETWTPAHWTEVKLSGDLTDLRGAVTGMTTATAGDVGKSLIAKTVSGGKVTEWEFGEAVTLDDTLTQAGEAADAKAAGDAIASVETAVETEQTRAAAAEALKVNKPTSSPNGTSGQLLRTNGDGTTQWVDQGLPTDEQTAEAVTAWLDAHPEATTTVEDGAITLPKLNSDLKDLVVVEADTEKAFFHNNNTNNITVYPNNYTQSIPFRYINKSDLFSPIGLNGANHSGFTKTKDGRYINITGTGSGSLVIFNSNNSDYLATLANKTLYICLYISKATVWNNTSWLQVLDGSTTLKQVKFTSGTTDLIGWNVLEVTMPASLSNVQFRFKDLTGSVFNTGDFYWCAAFEGQPTVTETIVTTDPVTISIGDVSYIDTMMHESTAKIIVPTKEYVDAHTPDIIGYWSENVYVMPENFGAKGDGVTDDATALADCISYAVTNGKAIKGYGKYKTSSPVVLSGSYMNVFLREVIYTGNQHAVEIQNMYTMLDFHKITSNADGLIFNRTSENTPHFARYCIVNGDAIICNGSAGNCVTLHRKTMYNTCEIRYLASDNGNCIEFSETGSSNDDVAVECVFRESSCHCPNGYAIKNPAASKFYDFTIEGDCKYGYFNPLNCVFIGIRHTEQIGRMKARVVDGNSSYNNGALFVFTKASPYISSNRYVSANKMFWFSVDTSEIQGFEPIEGGAGTSDDWQNIMYNGFGIDAPITGAGDTTRKILGKKMYIIGNNRVIEPEGRTEITITEPEVDFRLLDSMIPADIILAQESAKFLGTDFLLDVVNTEIYLNSYFGAIGYNDLTLTQANGNTAKIYDKLGNVLFDGTNEGDGTWRFQCIMDTSSNGRYQNSTFTWWEYDGTNEKWKITKID